MFTPIIVEIKEREDICSVIVNFDHDQDKTKNFVREFSVSTQEALKASVRAVMKNIENSRTLSKALVLNSAIDITPEIL